MIHLDNHLRGNRLIRWMLVNSSRQYIEPGGRWQRFSVVVTGTCLLAVFLTGLAGAWALRTTPVLGIKVSAFGDRLKVDSVQEQGPAAGLIMPGETVCSIGGVKLRATDRMRFPVYPGARAEREWWARQERIYAELIRTPCVSVTVASARRGERTVWLTTRKATWGAIVWANLPFYLSGIGLAILAWMIPLRGRNAGNLITKCVCAMMAIYHMAIAPSLVQEITVNPFIRNGLAHLAYVSISSTLFLALWPLVFPAKNRYSAIGRGLCGCPVPITVYPWPCI